MSSLEEYDEKLFKRIQENISEGDEFSEIAKLRTFVGLPKPKGNNSINAQNKKLQRYLTISNSCDPKHPRKIVVIEKHNPPKQKIDKRYSVDSQKLINEIKNIIIGLGTTNLSYSKLIYDHILPRKIEEPNQTQIKYYNNYLFNYLRAKIDIAIKQLKNEYGNDLSIEYDYIAKNKNSKYWYRVPIKDVDMIEEFKKAEKIKITAKYNNQNSQEKEWKDIAFRYKNLLYKKLSEELSQVTDIEKLYRVLFFKSNLKCKPTVSLETIYGIMKKRMDTYVDGLDNKKEVMEYHEKKF